jgi:NADH-quinone oxidoreductase subunit J
MNTVELIFFAVATFMVLGGGVFTVAARNPIRSAMGLLTSLVGVAGMYLLLSAEFLAAIQILVYVGAVVILFLFVIMLLGPSAMSERDTKTAISRYLAAGVFLLTSGTALVFLARMAGAATTLKPAPAGFGHIEAIGRELFSSELTPFELSGALLLVAVVGAVAVARGKQIDPTLHPATGPELPNAGVPLVGAPAPANTHASKESAK